MSTFFALLAGCRSDSRVGVTTTRELFGVAFGIGLVMLGACGGSEVPALTGVEVAGDRSVARRFEGRWFEGNEVLALEVELAGDGARLKLELPPGFSLTGARTVGDEIHFTLDDAGNALPMSLRLLADDVLVILPPDAPPSWCGTCTPRLMRFSAVRFAWDKLEVVREPVDAAWDDAVDWAIDHL